MHPKLGSREAVEGLRVSGLPDISLVFHNRARLLKFFCFWFRVCQNRK